MMSDVTLVMQLHQVVYFRKVCSSRVYVVYACWWFGYMMQVPLVSVGLLDGCVGCDVRYIVASGGARPLGIVRPIVGVGP